MTSQAIQVKIGLLLDLREYLHKDFLKINLKVNKASKQNHSVISTGCYGNLLEQNNFYHCFLSTFNVTFPLFV
jgi:hypothetical protein